MKLLTLNTHSLVEENYIEKLEHFVWAVSEEQPDVIALQEVNQSCFAAEIPARQLKGFTFCGNIPVRADNHAYRAVKMLSEKDIDYCWTWLGMKQGYGRYDEGIGLLSKSPILEADVKLISAIDDYNNWKTRKIIGIRTESCPEEWFYSVHLGWWDDSEEPFQPQWKKLVAHVSNKGRVWLMGDFNSPAKVRGEGYDMIRKYGWHDSFVLAENKDAGYTVGGVIDGWRDKLSDAKGMRIDQIWCSEKTEVASSRVIFNGKNRPVVSDHYGVIIETKE